MNLYRVFYDTRNTFKGFATLVQTKVAIVQGAFKEVALVETESLETLFREMNVVDGTELPVKLKVRSLSVGDIVVDVMTRKSWYCAPVGWTELDEKCTEFLEFDAEVKRTEGG
jgi:hypothetical protein